jgi:LPXTG-motif cell wall-anchored protein
MRSNLQLILLFPLFCFFSPASESFAVPDTGYSSHIGLWIGLCAAGFVLLIAALFLYRRYNRKK